MKILNFDIEEWFHILDNPSTKLESDWNEYDRRLENGLDRILKLLDEKNQKATFFCLGWVAREYPDVIRKIDSLGYEIATHSDMHQLIYEQSLDEFKRDLKNSIKSIEEITGKKVRAYRAPGFSLKEETKWVFDILLDCGIEIDCSIFPARRGHGGFKNFEFSKPALVEYNGMRIKEFPINTYEFAFKKWIFSGGGYFRVLPYPIINYFTRNSEYVMTYFHPRDFDENQPLIRDLPLIRKFKSYYGIKNSFRKFKKLLDNFNFVDLKTAENEINWDEVPVIKL